VDVHLDAQAIAWRLGRPWSTVRWWVHKGWLTQTGTDPEGRKLYSYEQAREVAARQSQQQLDKQP